MNLTGESFDYGPWRFLPRNDPGFTAAYFDQTGLYAFGRQPQAVFWNLQQLAGCLAMLEPDADALVAAVNGFAPAYRTALAEALVARLGVRSAGLEADQALAQATLDLLGEGGAALRWEPFFFDWFGGLASAPRALQGPRARLYDTEAFRALRTGLEAFETEREHRLQHPYFQRAEPQELLIGEIEALWAAIAVCAVWVPLQAKLEGIGQARDALGLLA